MLRCAGASLWWTLSVPIPAAPVGPPTTSAAVLALVRQLHTELRDLVTMCSDQQLNFVPCAGANSIATIVTHLLGSEAETLRAVADLTAPRDREAEFGVGRQSVGELIAQVDAADRLLEDLWPRVTDDRLKALGALPSLPSQETRPMVTWLIGNLGHSREHLGHAHLTRQLQSASP
jgi:hypothetical protein